MMHASTKFRYWLTCAVAAGWQMDADGYTRPAFVGKHATPPNFDALTFGQLIELSRAQTNDVFYDVCRIVLGMERDEVDNARAVDVVSFVGWSAEQVNGINARFAKLSHKPSELERKAGIERLKFGLFGLMDSYARRMHISNHDGVLAVPWLRVYRCLDMDNKTEQFNERYQKVIEDEYRRKNRSHRW